MSFIIDSIRAVLDIVYACANYLVNLVTGIFSLFKALPQLISVMMSALSSVPGWMFIFFSLSISFAGLFLFSGRNNGS